MITIDEVRMGDTTVVTAFGTATIGVVIDVDKSKNEFTYITDDSSEKEIINLKCQTQSKAPGNVYDIYKHGSVIIANFRSWQSGKYYANDYDK